MLKREYHRPGFYSETLPCPNERLLRTIVRLEMTNELQQRHVDIFAVSCNRYFGKTMKASSRSHAESFLVPANPVPFSVAVGPPLCSVRDCVAVPARPKDAITPEHCSTETVKHGEGKGGKGVFHPYLCIYLT